MYEFNHHQPTGLEEVANLLGANEEAKIVAGGMTLVPTLKFRLAKPSDLVDLAAISTRCAAMTRTHSSRSATMCSDDQARGLGPNGEISTASGSVSSASR